MSSNALVNVVDFLSQNILQDLEADGRPILQLDSIRFLYSFRNQVNLLLLPFLFGVLY